MLEVRSLVVQYGKAQILHGVSLDVGAGQLVALVGPNGAGKTTTLRAIAGLVTWDLRVLRRQAFLSGQIRFLGQEVQGLLPHRIARLGLVLCPERRRPFRELTVRENLLAGALAQKDVRRVHNRLAEAYELFPALRERERQRAGTLSGGEQQMLAIARALMAAPRLLLIDEPSTGLAPLVKRSVFQQIRAVRDKGLPVLVVDQDASLALSLADLGYVLAQGQVVAQGPQLLGDDTVRRSFLGL